MNTRSKAVSNTTSKLYKTHDIIKTNPKPKMADKDPTQPAPETVSIENMKVDQKLNMLIASVAKLESVHNNITKMQESIEVIQSDLKDIPVLKTKIEVLEKDLNGQKHDTNVDKANISALEGSLTTTQKDVHDFQVKMKELQKKMRENEKLINDF